jgi:hypothetical protein
MEHKRELQKHRDFKFRAGASVIFECQDHNGLNMSVENLD